MIVQDEMEPTLLEYTKVSLQEEWRKLELFACIW